MGLWSGSCRLHGGVQEPQYAHVASCIHAPIPSGSRGLSPPPAAWACSYLVPGHGGRWVAFNDSIKLCHITSFYLYILNSDLHGWGSWERGKENLCVDPQASQPWVHSPPRTSVVSEALDQKAHLLPW